MRCGRRDSIGRVVDVGQSNGPQVPARSWVQPGQVGVHARQDAAIRYEHLPASGGLRHAKQGSINNLGWENTSFSGFADYMATPEFQTGLAKLNDMLPTRRRPSCASKLCLCVADYRCRDRPGVAVVHLMSATSNRPCNMTSFAKLDRKSFARHHLSPADGPVRPPTTTVQPRLPELFARFIGS